MAIRSCGRSSRQTCGRAATSRRCSSRSCSAARRATRSSYGEAALRRRHRAFTITERGAERWLEHFAAALEAHEVEEALAGEIMDALRPLALRMVNTLEVVTRLDG